MCPRKTTRKMSNRSKDIAKTAIAMKFTGGNVIHALEFVFYKTPGHFWLKVSVMPMKRNKRQDGGRAWSLARAIASDSARKTVRSSEAETSQWGIDEDTICLYFLFPYEFDGNVFALLLFPVLLPGIWQGGGELAIFQKDSSESPAWFPHTPVPLARRYMVALRFASAVGWTRKSIGMVILGCAVCWHLVRWNMGTWFQPVSARA